MISAPISTLDSSEVFTQHKSVLNGGGSVIKHCTSIFSPTAVVAYIPTGVTAVGPIRTFNFTLKLLKLFRNRSFDGTI